MNIADLSDVMLDATYDEWGNVTAFTSSTGSWPIPFGFAGGLYDEGTGLVRFGARDYDPRIGRWTSKDPIRWGGGPTNFYKYASNNPTNMLDPRGLYAEVRVSGNNVSIVLPIDFSGPGANPTTVNNFIQAIQQTWSGQFGRYNVTTTVVPGDQNHVEITAGDGTAVVYDSWYGFWPEARPPWTIAHEAGHLMGLADTYLNTSEPSIMGTRGQPPTEANISDVIARNVNQCR